MAALSSSCTAACSARVSERAAVGRASARGDARVAVPSLALPRARPSVRLAASSGLNNMPGFGGGLGGGIKISKGNKYPKPEELELESEAGVDYQPLRDALEAGDFQTADDITRALLIQLAGEGAQERGWVYFTEVKTIGVKDMKSMDDLWRAYSEGKFGFSVQKNLFSQSAKRWPKFFKRINWVQGENNIYRKWPQEFIYSMEAEKGHLPLTNALRGTELIIAIFDHPAFAVEEKKRPKVGSTGFDSTSL